MFKFYTGRRKRRYYSLPHILTLGYGPSRVWQPQIKTSPNINISLKQSHKRDKCKGFVCGMIFPDKMIPRQGPASCPDTGQRPWQMPNIFYSLKPILFCPFPKLYSGYINNKINLLWRCSPWSSTKHRR